MLVFWGNKKYGSVLRPKRLLGIDAGSSGGDSPRPDRRVEIRREKMLPIEQGLRRVFEARERVEEVAVLEPI